MFEINILKSKGVTEFIANLCKVVHHRLTHLYKMAVQRKTEYLKNKLMLVFKSMIIVKLCIKKL